MFKQMANKLKADLNKKPSKLFIVVVTVIIVSGIVALGIRLTQQALPYDFLEQRNAELYQVQQGINGMMDELAINTIPNPANVAGGTATNNLASFPDANSGYVLYTNGPEGFVDRSTTEWYYTCEADGTVRQWYDAQLQEESIIPPPDV